MSVHIKFIYDLIETCSFTTGSIFLTVVMVKLVFRFSQERKVIKSAKSKPSINSVIWRFTCIGRRWETVLRLKCPNRSQPHLSFKIQLWSWSDSKPSFTNCICFHLELFKKNSNYNIQRFHWQLMTLLGWNRIRLHSHIHYSSRCRVITLDGGNTHQAVPRFRFYE